VTYARSEALREAVRTIPADRLLLETDCPYLSPEPYRGKTNEPALLGFTATEIARLRGEDVAELWERCGNNTRKFFGLDG
jgi:TatD DNase family protein